MKAAYFCILRYKSKMSLLSFLFISIFHFQTSGQNNSLSNLVSVISKDCCRYFESKHTYNFDSLDTYLKEEYVFKFMESHKNLIIETVEKVYGGTNNISGEKFGN